MQHDAVDEFDADWKPVFTGPLQRQLRGQPVEVVEASLAVLESLAWLDDVDVEPAAPRHQVTELREQVRIVHIHVETKQNLQGLPAATTGVRGPTNR